MRRTAAATVVIGLLLTGCARQAAPETDTGDGRLVMVSGRDDHGLVQTDDVPVHTDTTYSHVAGSIHDGTLVRVVQRDGMAMRVSTVEGPSVSGWLDDFHLRGQVRLVGAPPTCAVEVGGEELPGGTLALLYGAKGSRVLVETQPSAGQEAHRGWVPRADVQELPPQGTKCGADPAGSKHTH